MHFQKDLGLFTRFREVKMVKAEVINSLTLLLIFPGWYADYMKSIDIIISFIFKERGRKVVSTYCTPCCSALFVLFVTP